MLTEVVHLEESIPVSHVSISNVLELCFCVPQVTDLFKLIDLCLNKLISNLSQIWEVRDFFLEHNHDSSSFRSTNFGSSFLSIVYTEIFQIFLAVKIYCTSSCI